MAYTATPIDYEGSDADRLPDLGQKVNTNFQDIENEFNAWMGSGVCGSFPHVATGFIGGTTGKLDNINATDIVDGEKAIVVLGTAPPRLYFYRLKSPDSTTESSPEVIQPDTGGTTKRWRLAGRSEGEPHIGAVAPTVNDDEGDGYRVGDMWIHGTTLYICVDATTGAAVWVTSSGVSYGGEPGAVSSSTSGQAGVASTASRSDHNHDLGAHAHGGATSGGTVAHSALTGVTSDLHHAKLHSADHKDGGTDEIDGDMLAISWTGYANYTPNTSPTECDTSDDLTAHLKGIDDALASGGVTYGPEPGAVSTSTSGQAGTNSSVSRSDHNHDLGIHTHQNDTVGGQVSHANISGQTANDHHNQVHVLNSADHTVSGLTAEHALLATAPTTFAFGEIDGDHLDIDFTPSEYIPDASPAEADDVDDLTAHLKGADTRLGQLAIRDVTVSIDGGGAEIADNVTAWTQINYACTIQAVTLLADQSGSIVLDIWRDSYANYPPTVADTITASAKPTISSAIKSTDSTLTGWSKSITAGDILMINVDSCTTIQRVVLIIKVKVA